MRDRIVGWRGIDVHVVTLDFDRKAAQVVGPLVEGAARTEVEASVMPVAREDPVGHRAAMQGETHVRTPVVDGEDFVAFGEEADHVSAHADDEPPGGAELGQRGGA